MLWCFTGADAIRAAAEAVHCFSADHGLAEGAEARLAIVVEEIVTNIVEHGGVAAQESCSLTLSIGDDGIGIVLIDPGTPFDPRTAPSNAPDPDRGGGVGIDLVRAWTNILRYQSAGGENRLELLMPIRRKARLEG